MVDIYTRKNEFCWEATLFINDVQVAMRTGETEREAVGHIGLMLIDVGADIRSNIQTIMGA